MNAVLKQPAFQVKLGNKWEDIELGIELEQLHKELSSTVPGILAGRQGTNLNKVHQLVLQYHGATKSHIKEMFDIICVDYKLNSFEDDTLKFAYSFIVRFGTEKERERAQKVRAKHAAKEAKTKSSWPMKEVVQESRNIRGVITILPGN